MTKRHDVVVAGGSVGGLSFAAGAAKRGLDVLVLEEDAAIGEPEKCDGLVSLHQLRRYFEPPHDCIQSHVRRGVIHSPSGASVSLHATGLEVVVLDRREYDRRLAEKAEASGARIMVKSRVTGVRESDSFVRVAAGSTYEASIFVDATGPSSTISHNRGGMLPAAKYEVEGDWFEDGTVEVFTDQTKYPGFFAWVIPRGGNIAKVGVAGRGINSFHALDSFLSSRNHRVLRKVAAPIYVGGPRREFVVGRTVYVGESAGQVKPTTAGGITTSVAAGAIAAKWVADSLLLKDPGALASYQPDWERRFGGELRIMRRVRRLYESLTNKDLEMIVTRLSDPRVTRKLSSSDFDFHASSFISALGVRGLLRLAGLLVSTEARQALAGLVQEGISAGFRRG
jgi:geranylgeranyl reductase family protein